MTRKQRRLMFVAIAGAALVSAVALALFALRDTIVYFYLPSEIAQKTLKPGQRLRIGGQVKEGSLQRFDHGVVFEITDTARSMKVDYAGLLPDLFREGQGVVAEGQLTPEGGLKADKVLAKHDENYMPRETVESLKKQGLWQGMRAGGK